mgnify:CR=1 FL=1
MFGKKIVKKVNVKELSTIYDDIKANIKNKKRVYDFERYKLEYLQTACDMINSNTYNGGIYNIFIIYEPKLRVIMSQKIIDKIINHYITRTILIPKMDKYLLEENTATRKNKGYNYAINLLKKGIEYYKRYPVFYFLKMDIKKYFYNIDHQVLKNLIKPYLDEDEYKLMCSVLDSTNYNYVNRIINIISRKHHEDLPVYEFDKGLPIGNMTSQFLAVFYLYKLHHFIKHDLHIKYFVVYMDDYILLHQDKEYLKYCLKVIEDKLVKEYKLALNKNKTMVVKSTQGINFLGYRFIIKNKKTIIKLMQSSKKKIRKGIKRNLYKYSENYINYQKLFNSMENYKNGYSCVNRKKVNEIIERII